MVRNISELNEAIEQHGLTEALACCFGVPALFLQSTVALCPESIHVVHTTLIAEQWLDRSDVCNCYTTTICFVDLRRTYVSDDIGARLRFDLLCGGMFGDGMFGRTLFDDRRLRKGFLSKNDARAAARARRKIALWRLKRYGE